MLPSSKIARHSILLGLFISAFGWGISFFFTADSWPVAVERLYAMGASEIAYQPMLAYWLKMASAVFGCIGLTSAMAFVWPDRYITIIKLLVPFHLIVGATLIAAACGNQLDPKLHPTFPWDITFCFSVATLIGVPLVIGHQLKSPPDMPLSENT